MKKFLGEPGRKYPRFPFYGENCFVSLQSFALKQKRPPLRSFFDTIYSMECSMSDRVSITRSHTAYPFFKSGSGALAMM